MTAGKYRGGNNVLSRTFILQLIERLQQAESPESLVRTLESAAAELGFNHFAFGLRQPFPLSSPKTDLINNYPVLWQQRYSDNHYLHSDPTVSHGIASARPLIWHEEFFTQARPLWEEAREFGLCHGWAQSYRDAQGNVGMLTLARSEDMLKRDELMELAPYLSWIVQLAHEGFARFIIDETVRPVLTPREVEVLRWTAEGKTSWEISVILGISERTINFHINNSIQKLDVTNKSAAVVKAALGGML